MLLKVSLLLIADLQLVFGADTNAVHTSGLVFWNMGQSFPQPCSGSGKNAVDLNCGYTSAVSTVGDDSDDAGRSFRSSAVVVSDKEMYRQMLLSHGNSQLYPIVLQENPEVSAVLTTLNLTKRMMQD